jgi:signal transduction histidine kinase
MSHELRTPLNGIIGLTELMHDGVVGPVSDEHREYLGDILASSKHLLQLVNDVLDMAKIESGRMDFRTEPVDVGPLLGEVRDVLRILADKKNLSMTIDSGTVDSVMTDPARLKQVVYNYLSNAIKFAADGGVIQLRTRWEDGTSFRIEVEDNGPGIKPADIPRLFADFQQLDSDRPNLGSGLGLALTKRIVEGQGGTVGVRSTPGVGSVFFAVLPIRRTSEDDDGQPQLTASDVSGELPAPRTLALRMPVHI